MRLCILVTSKAAPIEFHRLSKCEMTKSDTSGHAEVDRKCHEASTLHKEPRATLGKLRAGEVLFPSEDLTNWLPSVKRSALEICL